MEKALKSWALITPGSTKSIPTDSESYKQFAVVMKNAYKDALQIFGGTQLAKSEADCQLIW
jgi:hypothetical protein